jgi:hypothetical protein
MRRLVYTVLSACIFVAMSSTALAVPPYKETLPPQQFLGYPAADCGTLDILVDWTAEIFIKVYFDKDGNWTKYVEQHRVVGNSVWYNSVNPEISFLGGPGENETYTWYPDGRYIVTGLSVKITVPGSGLMILDAGRTVFDTETGEILVQSGPSDYYGDTTALCELFAG